MKIRVYYEDTDAGGVVYHSNYLNFCERARSELFFELYPHIFDAQKGHFLLAKADCAFLKPAKLGDMLDIQSSLIKLKNASLIIKQEIFRQNVKLFSAELTLVYVKGEKAAPMSEELKDLFKKTLG